MRITGWHALGEEAVGVVQQAVSLAGRRWHAQVTPLHIASAMLSAESTAGVLRAACVRKQYSHPVQHDVLELCLDIALDRLAVARPASAYRGARVDPAPSNAFLAALKRAHAHRRQGEGVELEQLVLSILDDPSIDRVMRAAGFSSSRLVRGSVENAVSSDQNSAMAGGQPSLQTVHRSVVAQLPDHRRYPSISQGAVRAC
jgi:ATP-dependent Clp protease ATP-binding subunit ClpA